jgi:VWFA-related protein
VRVVAFSAGGRQLGEHAIEVNPAAGPAGERPLGVAISRLSEVPGEPLRLAVEVEVSLPSGSTLDRVEVWYGQTLAATLESPPFRTTLELPGPPGPADYVRAVAVLADGTTVDDARLLGAEGASERLAVNLVELFVVATDRRTGAPVTGLGPEAFTIREGRNERPVESFRVADQVPLELAVLIDTSESMWPLMPDTKKAASKFLAETLADGDRAFLVDFATKPRLVRAATGDLLELLAAFGGLEAGGATALYDSIVFATTQFDDVPGRRAVVLLTDGVDYGSRFGPRRSIEQAQAAGAPVYVVSLAGLWNERGGTPRNNDLEGITGQTGGRIFYISDLTQLDSAYAEINAELRSQYVLAYSTERPRSPEELAKLEVKVEAPGRRLDARTVAAPGR